MANLQYDYLLKFISIGDSGVGKSCLLLRLTTSTFHATETTIGIEFGSSSININNRTIKLQIWDTAGQESFRSISRAYYRNASGCLLVYDVSRRETFEHLRMWREDVENHGNDQIRFGFACNLRCIVVANKVEPEIKRVVSREEGEAFAKDNGMLYIETSAKLGRNVQEVFDQSLMKGKYPAYSKVFTILAEKIFNDLNLYRDISQFKEEEIKKLESCGIKVGPRKPLVLVSSPTAGHSSKCC